MKMPCSGAGVAETYIISSLKIAPTCPSDFASFPVYNNVSANQKQVV